MSTAGWRWCRRMWRMPARLDMRPRSPRRPASPRMATASACTAARRSAISTPCCRPRCSARTRRWLDCRRGRPHLQSIDAAQGTPGQGTDIASLLGKLQDQFSTLLNDPASAPQQSQVVWAATTLAQGINAAQRRLRHAAPDGGGQHRHRDRDAEHDAGHHRWTEQQDRHAEGWRPEHRRSGEPARRRAGRPVATARREGAGTAERRSDGRHERRPRSADPWRDKSVRHWWA